MTPRQYWKRQLRRIVGLLIVWATVAFGLSIFAAPALNDFSLGGVPFGFWMAQQGSIYVFVMLILVYAWASDRADREAGLAETTDTTSRASDAH